MPLASRRLVLSLSGVCVRLVGRASVTQGPDAGGQECKGLSSVSLVGESIEQ